MPFATDRDLLLLEPTLFRDAAWSAQTLVSVASASLSGTTLTAASANFTTAGIAAGHIALLDGAPLEILDAPSATTLTVSRLRAATTDDPIPPLPVSSAPLRIVTFAPQIALIHAQLLRALGVHAVDSQSTSTVAEHNICNPDDLAHTEALGAIHLILTAASALAGEQSTSWVKAQHYRERFAEERRRAVALIDLDSDGKPDATRRISLATLSRA